MILRFSAPWAPYLGAYDGHPVLNPARPSRPVQLSLFLHVHLHTCACNSQAYKAQGLDGVSRLSPWGSGAPIGSCFVTGFLMLSETNLPYFTVLLAAGGASDATQTSISPSVSG